MRGNHVLGRAEVQIAVFILFAFSTLGPYNGLNALGGAGLKDHMLATKINCIYALSLSFLGWLGGAAFNYYGCRVVSVIANLCYMSYILTISLITFYGLSSKVIYATGIILGLGASFLWAAFGAISIRYPMSESRARTFAIMWCFTNLGGFACGLLSLVINFKNLEVQEMNLMNYYVLGSLMIFGSVQAVFFLRHQDEVVRHDGEFAGGCLSKKSAKEILGASARGFADPKMVKLCPLFLAPFAHMPFLFNGLNGHYFNIRSRSLNSSIYWFSRIPGGLIFFGMWRGVGTRSVAAKLKTTFLFSSVWAVFCLSLANVLIFDWFQTFSPPTSNFKLDFSDSRNIYAIAAFSSFGILDALIQSFCKHTRSFSSLHAVYNLLGHLAANDLSKAAVYSSVYKTLQSLTVGCMWGLDWFLSSHQFLHYAKRYQIHWLIMASFWLVAIPFTLQHVIGNKKLINDGILVK